MGQPLLNLLFDRRGEHLLRPGPEDLRHRIPTAKDWNHGPINATFTHGGVLLGDGCCGKPLSPKVRRLLQLIRTQHSVISRAACEKELDRTVAGLRKAYQKIYDIGEPRRFRYSGPVCDDCEKLVHSNVSAGTEDSYFGYNSAAAYRVFPFTELEVPFTGHCWGEITCKKTGKVFTIDFWKGETDFWRDGMDAFGWKALRR